MVNLYQNKKMEMQKIIPQKKKKWASIIVVVRKRYRIMNATNHSSKISLKVAKEISLEIKVKKHKIIQIKPFLAFVRCLIILSQQLQKISYLRISFF